MTITQHAFHILKSTLFLLLQVFLPLPLSLVPVFAGSSVNGMPGDLSVALPKGQRVPQHQYTPSTELRSVQNLLRKH